MEEKKSTKKITNPQTATTDFSKDFSGWYNAPTYYDAAGQGFITDQMRQQLLNQAKSKQIATTNSSMMPPNYYVNNNETTYQAPTMPEPDMSGLAGIFNGFNNAMQQGQPEPQAQQPYYPQTTTPGINTIGYMPNPWATNPMGPQGIPTIAVGGWTPNNPYYLGGGK